MAKANNTPPDRLLDNYPKRIAFIRWLLLIAEAALAVYLIITFNQMLGVAFLAYGVVCLFLIFPLIRCVRCSYYGKRCNFGWGRFWVSRFFPKSENSRFDAYYGWSVIFWPLKIIPLVLGLRFLPAIFMGKFFFLSQGMFIIYLAILLIHRRFYRARACTRCHQRAICPVYAGHIVAIDMAQ
jgi:hypothetical protein